MTATGSCRLDRGELTMAGAPGELIRLQDIAKT